MKRKEGAGAGAADAPAYATMVDEDELKRQAEAARASAVCNHMANALAKVAKNRKILNLKSDKGSISTADTLNPNSTLQVSGLDSTGWSTSKTMKLRPIT